jgi:hypothetical protein
MSVQKELCGKRICYNFDKYHFFSLRLTVFRSITFLRSGGNAFHNLGTIYSNVRSKNLPSLFGITSGSSCDILIVSRSKCKQFQFEFCFLKDKKVSHILVPLRIQEK